MGASRALPLCDEWPDDETYVDSLLDFAANTEIFRNLCGGIHILDFMTREPDLYSTVLPEEWRQWFRVVSAQDVLELLLREDLGIFANEKDLVTEGWKGGPRPPQTLLDYVKTIRRYCLLREPTTSPATHDTGTSNHGSVPEPMPRHIAVGMKPKKIHEVENFASFVDKLSQRISDEFGYTISDIVDFGSGQNYLGRTLASPPYHKHVIAIERRHHNVEGARGMDVHAKLAKKEKILRNKKEWKRFQSEGVLAQEVPRDMVITDRLSEVILDDGSTEVIPVIKGSDVPSDKGRITYVEHEIKDGYLEHILSSDSTTANGCSTDHDSTGHQLQDAVTNAQHENHKDNRMIISLHSCGNLVHHGLRSLVLNPSVIAVAMIGCCYNLMTERLGPDTYTLPILRPFHPRLESTGSACDPHGFPMSKHLERYQHTRGQGLRLNITARMMAVQAPYNWGPGDSEAFFTRHFYRALLQRILLDVGVVDKPVDEDGMVGGAPNGINAAGSPLIVGSLRKAAFVSFHTYARAALRKLSQDPTYGSLVAEKTADLSDKTLAAYEADYASHKKNLSIIWSLMAFSAGVVESIIAVDRWLYLREQDCVEACWVEPVFDYSQSPRNLVVVGIKKPAK